MASGYVHLDAITNGVYMKALNNRESIALVLIDLADNYNAKFPNNDGTFILKCCETAIKEYPQFASALILKAETHFKQIKKIENETLFNQQFKELEAQKKAVDLEITTWRAKSDSLRQLDVKLQAELAKQEAQTKKAEIEANKSKANLDKLKHDLEETQNKINEFKKNPPNRTGDALLESLKNKSKN